MLKKFAVENYKTFKERIELDLTSSRNYDFNKDHVKDGIIKDAIIYGKNGSGKTSLGYALFDIVATLTDFNTDPSQKDSSIFLNACGTEDYATFEYYFQFEGSTVSYIYRKTSPDVIIYEKFLYKGQTVFEIDYRTGISDFTNLGQYDAGNLNVNNLSGKMSFLKFIARNTNQSADSPIHFVMEFVSGMLYFRSLQTNSYIGLAYGSESLEQYIIKEGLVGEFQEFLKSKADIDVKLDVAKVEGSESILMERGEHRSVIFSKVMSSGTKSLMLFYYWMKHLEHVKLLFLDEFDIVYHHETARKLLGEVFRKDSQIILASYDTSLISNGILRPDCYLVISDNGIKSMPYLTERHIREGHNIEKLYRSGEFEG